MLCWHWDAFNLYSGHQLNVSLSSPNSAVFVNVSPPQVLNTGLVFVLVCQKNQKKNNVGIVCLGWDFYLFFLYLSSLMIIIIFLTFSSCCVLFLIIFIYFVSSYNTCKLFFTLYTFIYPIICNTYKKSNDIPVPCVADNIVNIRHPLNEIINIIICIASYSVEIVDKVSRWRVWSMLRQTI